MDVEWEAVAFLRARLQEKGPMSRRVLAGCLSQATEAIRETAGKSPEGVNEFVKSYPNKFRISKDGIITLPAKEISLKTQAVHFVQEILMKHGMMDIKTLNTHMRGAMDNVREVAGRNEQRLTSFISQHPMQFHISEDSLIDRTSKVFIDTVSATSCDDNAIILNVVDMFLANGIYSCPIVDISSDLHKRVTCQVDIGDLTQILVKSALFHVNKTGDVIFRFEKLTEKVFLALFICAVLDEECTLSITELLAKIAPFELTKVVGLQTYYGLSKFLDAKMFITVDGFVGLAESSEAQALEYVFKTVKHKNELSIQELNAELLNASENVQDAVGNGISGIRAFLDDYETIFLISDDDDDDYVSLQTSSDVVMFFQQKLKNKGKIPLKDVHSYLNTSPDNVKNVALNGIGRVHDILLRRKDVFSLLENDVIVLKQGSRVAASDTLASRSTCKADSLAVKTMYSGVVKKLQKLYGTIVVNKGTLSGEEVYFNNKNCKFLEVGEDLTKFIQKGQILIFELEKGAAGGIYKWIACNLSLHVPKPLSKESVHVKSVNQRSLSQQREYEAIDFLSKTLKSRKVLNIQALTGHLAQASADVRSVLGGLTEMRTFLEAHDDLFILTEYDNVILSSTSESEMQDPVELLKNILILLLPPRKMIIHNLLEALQKVMSKETFLPTSIYDFRQIIKQYEIFRLDGDTVILKVSPSKGCISKTFGKNGFINKTYDNKDVYYRKSAIYIQPETERKKKNSVIRERTWVKYIAVNVSSIPEKVQGNRIAPLRAILVWPKDGPDPGKLELKKIISDAGTSATNKTSDKQQLSSLNNLLKNHADAKSEVSKKQGTSTSAGTERHQYGSTTSLSSTDDNLNPSDDHNDLLKNTVLLLLQGGKLKVSKLHSALQKCMPKESFLPATVSNFQYILSQYDIFSSEEDSVILKATPTKGCIAKTFGKNGIINKTKDNKDVYYRQSAIYIPASTESSKKKCLIKERTRVMYVAVDVSALPEKVQGNRVAPLRAVLVWPKDGPEPSKLGNMDSEQPHLKKGLSEEPSSVKYASSSAMVQVKEILPVAIAMSMSITDIAGNIVKWMTEMIKSSDQSKLGNLEMTQAAEIFDLTGRLLVAHDVLKEKTLYLRNINDDINQEAEPDYVNDDKIVKDTYEKGVQSNDDTVVSDKSVTENDSILGDSQSTEDDNSIEDDNSTNNDNSIKDATQQKNSTKDDTSNKDDDSIMDNNSSKDDTSDKDDDSTTDNNSTKDDTSDKDDDASQHKNSTKDDTSNKDDDSTTDNNSTKDDTSDTDDDATQNKNSTKDDTSNKDDDSTTDNNSTNDDTSDKDDDATQHKNSTKDDDSTTDNNSTKVDTSDKDDDATQHKNSTKDDSANKGDNSTQDKASTKVDTPDKDANTSHDKNSTKVDTPDEDDRSIQGNNSTKDDTSETEDIFIKKDNSLKDDNTNDDDLFKNGNFSKHNDNLMTSDKVTSNGPENTSTDDGKSIQNTKSGGNDTVEPTDMMKHSDPADCNESGKNEQLANS